MKIIKLLFYSLLILLIGRLAGGAGSSAETPQRSMPLTFSSNLPTAFDDAAKAPSSYGQNDSMSYIPLHYYSFNKPTLAFPLQRPTLMQK